MLNIRDICKSKSCGSDSTRIDIRSKFWRKSAEEGRPGWQRIVLTLIADGLGPLDTSVLDLMATLGIYQDGVLKKAVDDKPTVAHIFEVSCLPIDLPIDMPDHSSVVTDK